MVEWFDSLEEACEMAGGDYEKEVIREEWMSYTEGRGVNETCVINGAKIKELPASPREANPVEVTRNGMGASMTIRRVDESYKFSQRNNVLTVRGAKDGKGGMSQVRIDTDGDSISELFDSATWSE